MAFLRRIFFYLFTLIYLIFCPIIILYALGYIYNPDSEKAIVKSGLIYLATVPQGANIYLENRRFIRRTPVVLSNLIPGEYNVRLLRKKYKPWEGKLPVEAGKATVLERILLLPETWNQKRLRAQKYEDLIPIIGSRFFLLKAGDEASNFSLYDWKDDQESLLIPLSSGFKDFEFSNYFSVEKSTNLVVELKAEGSNTYLWIGLKPKEPAVKDLSTLLPAKIEHVSWPEQDKKYVFAYEQGNLHRLDLTEGTQSAPFLTGILGYGFFERKLYVLKNDFTLERMDLDGKSEKTIFQDATLGASLFKPQNFYRIKIFSADFFSEPVILFLSDEGELLANKLPYRFVEKGMKGIDFNSRSKRVLVWTDNALGVLDFSKGKETEEQAFEPAPKLIWLVKGRNKIRQAFWVYEGSHILFRDREKLFLLEFENYRAPVLHELFSVEEDSSVFYSEESGKLFYIEPETGNLISVHLLPKWEILASSFLEEKLEEGRIKVAQI